MAVYSIGHSCAVVKAIHDPQPGFRYPGNGRAQPYPQHTNSLYHALEAGSGRFLRVHGIVDIGQQLAANNSN